MATEMMTVEQIEALQVVALSSHPANKGWVAIRDTQLSALLAMAKAHLELVSALKYLANGKDLFDLWQEGDAYFCHAPTEEAGTGWRFAEKAILEHAKATGWQSPTAKGGSDG